MKLNLFAGVLAASLAVPALANEDVLVASVPEFTAADTQQLFEQDARPTQLAALSQQEMMETEGAYWPLVYGAAWLGARAVMWVAPRLPAIGNTFRVVGNTNNHRVLLHNNAQILHTGGTRVTAGLGQNASHIGWSAGANNRATQHMFLNRPWSIR